MCSDGFWEIFPVAEIKSLFDAHDPGRTLATGFREKLRSLKSHDNTTAILAQVEPGPRVVWYWAAVAALAALAALTLGQPGKAAAEPPAPPVPLGHTEAAGTANARRETRNRRPSNGADRTLGPVYGSPPLAAQSDHIGRRGVRLRAGLPPQFRTRGSNSGPLTYSSLTGSRPPQSWRRNCGKPAGSGPTTPSSGKETAAASAGRRTQRLQQMHQGIPVLSPDLT